MLTAVCAACDGRGFDTALRQCERCDGGGQVTADSAPSPSATDWQEIPNSEVNGGGGKAPWRGRDHDDRRQILPVDPHLVALVTETLDVTDGEADVAARDLGERIRQKKVNRLAEQVLADLEAAHEQNLAAARGVNALDFLQETDEPPAPLLGELMAEGHNATLTAAFKKGKSTTIENATAALVTGGRFLGRFQVDRPRRVALVNYELTEDDMRARLRALALPPAAAERLHVINLRGSRLSLTSPAGLGWMADQLTGHKTEVAIIDGYNAAVAPSIESENDNAGARRFLGTLDHLKAATGCTSLIMTAHTGRGVQEEGAEHARGATVIDDWADVRLVLTSDRVTGVRFLASEGRSSYSLPESALAFDATTRGLWLPGDGVGLGRAAQRKTAAGGAAADAVKNEPGITTTDLWNVLADAGITHNDDKAMAVGKAKADGLIHTHRDGRKQRHYPGPGHDDTAACSATLTPTLPISPNPSQPFPTSAREGS